MMRALPTWPLWCGTTTGWCRCCFRWAMACSPRSSGTTEGSPDHGLQGVTKFSRLVRRQLNNESAAAFKRDAHHDAAALLGDLERTVARPRLHRRHYPIPFLRAPRTAPWSKPCPGVLAVFLRSRVRVGRRFSSAPGLPGHCARHNPGPPAAEPASHNRFYLSPYYPVFGTRMVMIGQARWRRGVRLSHSGGSPRWRRRVARSAARYARPGAARAAGRA